MPKGVALAFVVTLLAGMSTVIGALIAFCIPLKYTIFLPMALAFSAGVMIYISFVEIISEAGQEFTHNLEAKGNVKNVEFTAHLYTTLTFFSGIIIGYIIDFIVHKLGFDGHDLYEQKDNKEHTNDITTSVDVIKSPGSNDGINNDLNDDNQTSIPMVTQVTSQVELIPKNNPKSDDSHDSSNNVQNTPFEGHQLSKVGMVTALAIALHNFPEGIATFFATLSDPKLGVGLAVAIGIHNIPEGISVALPIYYADKSKCKAFWLAFVSGLFEPLGGLTAFLLIDRIFGQNNELAVMLALCAGIMIYISFKELLPIARLQDSNDKYCTALVFLGFFVMDISILLFEA